MLVSVRRWWSLAILALVIIGLIPPAGVRPVQGAPLIGPLQTLPHRTEPELALGQVQTKFGQGLEYGFGSSAQTALVGPIIVPTRFKYKGSW